MLCVEIDTLLKDQPTFANDKGIDFAGFLTRGQVLAQKNVKNINEE